MFSDIVYLLLINEEEGNTSHNITNYIIMTGNTNEKCNSIEDRI